jgi:hypothetical protein
MNSRGRVALLVIALVVLVGGGGAAYLVTMSSGAYPSLMSACTLVSPTYLPTLVPEGIPNGDPTDAGDTESSCTWNDPVDEGVGPTYQKSELIVRVRRYGRGLLKSADDNAHQALRAEAGDAISGYGDEATKVTKAHAGRFDGIEFRESNLVVEVGAVVKEGPGDNTALAWSRTQQAAAVIHQRLRALRH